MFVMINADLFYITLDLHIIYSLNLTHRINITHLSTHIAILTNYLKLVI